MDIPLAGVKKQGEMRVKGDLFLIAYCLAIFFFTQHVHFVHYVHCDTISFTWHATCILKGIQWFRCVLAVRIAQHIHQKCFISGLLVWLWNNGIPLISIWKRFIQRHYLTAQSSPSVFRFTLKDIRLSVVRIQVNPQSERPETYFMWLVGIFCVVWYGMSIDGRYFGHSAKYQFCQPDQGIRDW